jgi:hypothetical protein
MKKKNGYGCMKWPVVRKMAHIYLLNFIILTLVAGLI